MTIRLGSSSFFVRGFHLSLLRHGTIEPNNELTIATEDGNLFDPNAVKILDSDGVFIGHIAIEQSQGFRDVMRKSRALDIQMRVNFSRTEQETITKPNGSRYQATRVVISVHYFLHCHLHLYAQKFHGIKNVLETNSFLFAQGEKPSPSVVDNADIVLDMTCKRLADDCTALQAKNKRLKIDLIKCETTVLSQKEIIDQYRNAALLQRSLCEERQYGTVTMSLLISEKEAMPDVKWRPVASAILYNESGTVVMNNGDIVYKQTFYQVKKEGIFNRLIR